MELDRDNIKKIRGLILFTLLLLVGLWKYEIVISVLRFVLNILFPFILGGAIAFVLNVPMHFLEKKIFGSKKAKKSKMLQKVARPCSLIITILLVLSIIGIVIFVVVPQLGETVIQLGGSIQEFAVKAQKWGEELFRNNKEITDWVTDLQFDWQKIIQGGIDFFRSGAGSVLNSTFAAAKSIISGLTTFLIAFIFGCYVLLQKEKLSLQIQKVTLAFLPTKKVGWLMEVCSLTYKTFSNFITGQCVEAVILGLMFFIAMTILGFPYAMLIGVLIAFTALIPIFGAFVGCFIGAFLILVESPIQALGFVLLFLALQQIEGNVIYPRVVGSSVGLPSIWVLAAVSIGGNLMGVAGMLLFIPIISVVYALFRRNVYQRLKEKNIELISPKEELEE